MKPWFEREQEITEFKEPVAYKGLNISVSKTKVKPPYIATITSPATGKEVLKAGGDTEQEALDSAKQAIDKREADAPQISAGGKTSVLLNTPSNNELLKDPSMYNTVYAKISKDKNGPTLVIGNEVYGSADLEASGFVGSYDRRMKRNKDGGESLPQIMFNANNKFLSQAGIKMNGRYSLDTAGKYRDEDEHTVYPLQFQGSTVHSGDRLRMNRPALTIGATREDVEPWFQRELEEAEIIKFPEPEKKVLQMPSVASYPDFMTGVADLKAKVSKGDISQASHDKLYTDLIHRFMRKESFETPWFLREDQTQQIDQTIDQIADLAKGNDPKLQDHVKKVFQKVIDYANKAIGQQQESINEEPQIATAPPDQMANFLKSKLDDMIAKLGSTANDPKIKKYLEKQLNDIRAYAEKSDVQKGMDIGRNELNAFLTKYDGAINALTNKITSAEQAFVDANSDATGKTMQKDVSTKKRTIDAIKGVVNSIFTGKLFKKGAITDQQLQNKLLTFLKAAIEGIVDWGRILEAGKGNKASVEQFVPAEFKEMFELFKTELFRARPPTTAGAWGPGEVGLILIGNPITKAGDGGDLQDSKTGKKFELKGSNNPKKGGRLSPEGLSTSKNPKAFKTVKDKHIGAKRLQQLGKNSYLNYPSLNLRFIKAYNELVDKGLKIDTKQFLTDTVIAAFTTNFPTNKELAPYVKQMVVGNKIDYDMFVRAYAKFLMVRYQGEGKDKNFEGIIVFNPGTTTYTVLGSSADLDSDHLEISGGIEFGATQVPKSPQIGIA